MSMPKYAGMALGGSMAGQMIEAHRPHVRLNPKVAIIGVAQKTEEYFYVPLMGLQGLWLYEGETKGTGPWDDIIRILSEHYQNSHREGSA